MTKKMIKLCCTQAINAACHLAEGRHENSDDEQLQNFKTHLTDAQAYLKAWEDKDIRQFLMLITFNECGVWLASVLEKITKEDRQLLSATNYVIEPIIQWLKNPTSNPEMAVLLEKIFYTNYRMPAPGRYFDLEGFAA